MPGRAGRAWILFLFLYFGIHLGLRVWVSPALDLDESEQVVLSQSWELGYYSGPPLYTWLQKIFLSFLGLQVFSLSLLKQVLLLGLYLAAYFLGKRIGGTASAGVLASGGMLLLPQLGWEAQRDLSHSVLATALASVTLLQFFRLQSRPSAGNYLLFGTLAGLGLLSKYNFLLFLLCLVAAALSVNEWRKLWSTRKALLALLTLLLISSPHFVWLWRSRTVVDSESQKLHLDPALFDLSELMESLGSLAAGVVPYVLLLGAVFFFWFGRQWKMKSNPAPSTQLLTRYLLFTMAGLLFLCFFFQMSIKERWLLPLFFMLPLWICGQWAGAVARLSSLKLMLPLLVAAAVILCGIPSRVLLAKEIDRPVELNLDFQSLAGAIRNSGFSGGTIVAENLLLGGNLKMHFPDSLILVPERFWTTAETPPQLMVWSPAKRNRAASPFSKWISAEGIHLDQHHPISISLLSGTSKDFQLQFIVCPKNSRVVEKKGPRKKS